MGTDEGTDERKLSPPEQIRRAWEEEEGIFKFLPIDIMGVGAGLGMAPGAGYIISQLRATSITRSAEGPCLKAAEKKLMRLAAEKDREFSWAELWLVASGRVEDVIYLVDHQFNLQVREEVVKVLRRIEDVFLSIWQSGPLFERAYPDESRWWKGFLADWGVASNPLGYVRSLSSDYLLPPLRDVIGRELAQEFRTLCRIIHGFLMKIDTGDWRFLPLTEHRFRRLAGKIQAEMTVVGSVGIMHGLLGLKTEAFNLVFSFLERKPGERYGAPIELSQVVLSHRTPRAVVMVREKETGPFHEDLVELLRAAKRDGRIKKLHLLVRSNEWGSDWDPVPIGDDDQDPALWDHNLVLIGPARLVESQEEPD